MLKAEENLSMMNLQNERPLVIGWCVSSLSLKIASVRYRAVLPIVALEALGHTCHLFTSANPVDLKSLDALIVVKDFSVDTYRLIQRAKSLKIPVIFDLCDNIFVEGYGKHSVITPSKLFLAIAKCADAIVVTTTPLANVISRHVANAQVVVIPDGIIYEATNAALDARLFLARANIKPARKLPGINWLKRLRHLARVLVGASLRALIKKRAKRWWSLFTPGFWKRRIDRVRAHLRAKAEMASTRRQAAAITATQGDTPPTANASQLLWFGNHGAEYADFGMLDLLRIRDELEAVALEYSVELVVVSNNREKYDTHIQPMAIRSRYVEWSPASIDRELKRATLVLIPNSLDDFSICKSANRSVHALINNLPVVATNTPSLLPLSGSIAVNDFGAGLRRYLSCAQHAADDVARGQQLALTHFGPAVIAEAWQHTLREAIAKGCIDKPVPQVIFVLNLIQDVDMMLPIISEAQKRAVPFEVWSSSALLKKHPRVLGILQGARVSPTVILESEADRAPIFAAGTKALLTVTETNLAPHVFTRTLTRRAQKAGLRTATMQHGFENVGLTYSDEIHHICKVNFASEKVFLWGPLDTLHPGAGSLTRNKCVPVGCPKPVGEDDANLDHLISPAAPVVGIFENLHWHRYDEAYRTFFIDGVVTLAKRFPEVIFLIKPHQAGVWLTKRYKGDRPVAANLLIADPESSDWQNFTADQLLGRMAAVITSPSTIALDAARRGLSVAVVAHQLQLDQYRPLPRISATQDWVDFVASALANTQPDVLSNEFIKRTVIEGPAASKILDDLII
ncbi:hypothetical protein [Pseudomonas vlassakiae]|uniref:Capsule polysaccharide biosynthesis protein n=1 Tax=Pseudomonas vlassakiae TaxID=485888 RepID=A0A923K5T7_9PSED|nr:hypothetical protein [Pseudomonas vlassakiae]MBV4539625.1 hypothetical protein [Pseudomonas vlassakiae]